MGLMTSLKLQVVDCFAENSHKNDFKPYRSHFMTTSKPITLEEEKKQPFALFKTKSKFCDRYTKEERKTYNSYYYECWVSKNGIKKKIAIRIPENQVAEPLPRYPVLYELVSRKYSKYSFLTDKMNREEAITQVAKYIQKFILETNWTVYITDIKGKRQFLHSTNKSHQQFINYLCQQESN